MSVEWPKVPLAELLTQIERTIICSPGEKYRLLGVRLDGGGAFLREVRCGAEISAKTLNQVHEGDFIYSRLFAWRGAFGYISKHLDGCCVSNEFPIFAADGDRLNVRFLVLWFRLGTVLSEVGGKCTGSTPLTRNRFKEKFLLAMRVPLPPKDEQDRIVSRAELMTSKVEECLRLTTEMKQALDALIERDVLGLA
jgi:type I restriction enzyme S subunit